MANSEHLEILKQGIGSWNIWREENPNILPDLRNARPERSRRSGSPNRGPSSWIEAEFSGANLRDANLRVADLTLAFLSKGNLSGANLNAANLSRANLVDAKLREANLTDANLRNAIFGGTQVADTDLRTARGLETATHLASSTIGIDTIYQSHGEIPEVFLRGAGVPEPFITHMRALVGAMEPIQFYSCFVSYSHAKKSFARRLHDTLQGRGIRCWLDEKQLLPGHDIYEEVDRGIRLWDKILLCCSKHSLTSWWVDNEIAKAFAKEQQLTKERGKRCSHSSRSTSTDISLGGKTARPMRSGGATLLTSLGGKGASGNLRERSKA